LNPANCDSAIVTILVDPSPIVAVDDPLPAVNSFVGGTTASVLDNDLLNGAILDPAAVTLTPRQLCFVSRLRGGSEWGLIPDDGVGDGDDLSGHGDEDDL
jgi:hypothetical protein